MAASFDHISVKILLLPNEKDGLLLVYIEMASKLFCTAKQKLLFQHSPFTGYTEGKNSLYYHSRNLKYNLDICTDIVEFVKYSFCLLLYLKLFI